MSWIGRLSVLVTLGIICGAPASWSQDGRDDALKRTVERRFDVLPLHDGVVLRPKVPIAGVRSIELASGLIAVDGQPATGAELRRRLGADADALLQLSYLSDAARQALFADAANQPSASTSGGSPATPVVPPAPAPDIAPPPPLPDGPTPSPQPRRSRNDRRRSGDRVRVGGSVTIDEGEVVDGDVVAVGGPVTVSGEVRGDVVAVGGGVTLGPHAVIGGDVTAVGGPLHRDPGAQVSGQARAVSLGEIDLSRWTWRRNPVGLWWTSVLGSAFAFVGTLVRVAVLCLFAALVMLFARDYVERAALVATAEPIKAGAVGVAVQVLFVPLLIVTIVVLVMTIVGIPLLLALPLVMLGLAIAWLVGFAGVANRLGSVVLQRIGRTGMSPTIVTIVGVLVVMAPVVLSRLLGLGGGLLYPFAVVLLVLGAVIEYIAWTVGLGAIALVRFRKARDGRTGETGPAVGPAISAPSSSAF